ncbi:MAG: tRNA-specific adenosine deaminase [Gammaproteobacteria bacterium]|nr:MAG: tRNA-specific adenosine deaminase [Gammaproteobacteria bacterium]
MIGNHKVPHSDEYFMELAIEQAVIGQARGEVPVGALFVEEDEVVVASANASIEISDPTAHAEVMVMRKAAQFKKGKFSIGRICVVTLEPCLMCLGAMIHARIERLVFGTHDIVSGAAVSVYNLAQSPHQNHRIEVVEGILKEKCQTILKEFFLSKRQQ